MVSVRELAEAFTPTADEVSWACVKVLGPGPRLALLVMLKCYQRLGYFPQLERVPPEVVEYVHAQAVEVVEDRVGPLGRQGDRMVRRCRELVRERTGAVWDPQRVRGVAESAMRAALQSKDNPADMINVALEALSGHGCELPAYLTLDRLAAALRTEVNGGFHRLVSGRLDAAGRAGLLELLVVDLLSRQSALPRLTRPAPRATVSRLREHIAWLAWLDALGPTEEWLAGVPPAKVSHFAGEAAVLDADPRPSHEVFTTADAVSTTPNYSLPGGRRLTSATSPDHPRNGTTLDHLEIWDLGAQRSRPIQRAR
jgi:Domain of unknown function (DUF4158)